MLWVCSHLHIRLIRQWGISWYKSLYFELIYIFRPRTNRLVVFPSREILVGRSVREGHTCQGKGRKSSKLEGKSFCHHYGNKGLCKWECETVCTGNHVLFSFLMYFLFSFHWYLVLYLPPTSSAFSPLRLGNSKYLVAISACTEVGLGHWFTML